MVGSFLNDDLDTMLNTDEFAESVTWTPSVGDATSIDGIFDQTHVDINPITGEVINEDPVFTCKADDVSGIKQGDTITRSAVVYKILKAILDETGYQMTIYLNKVVS